MKLLLVVFVGMIFLTPLFAQEGTPANKPLYVTFSAGTTCTLISDFHNRLLIAPEGLNVPGLIDPRNSSAPLMMAEGHSTVRPLMGWFMEVEAGYKLPRNYAITFSLGLKKMRFDYQTTFSLIDNSYFPDPVNLDDLHDEFGYSSLLYVSITPFNISKGFLKNRLIAQAGITLSRLVDSEVNNTIVLYTSPESQANMQPDMSFFDTVGQLNDWITGVNLGAEYKIVKHIGLKLSAQYSLTSLYTENSWLGIPVDKINPLVIQTGITFEF